MKIEGREQDLENRGSGTTRCSFLCVLSLVFGSGYRVLRSAVLLFVVLSLGFVFNACERRSAAKTVLDFSEESHESKASGEKVDQKAHSAPTFFKNEKGADTPGNEDSGESF